MNKQLKLHMASIGMICFELLSLLPLLLCMVGLAGKLFAPDCSNLLNFISNQLTSFEFVCLGLLGAILLIMLQLLKSLRFIYSSIE